MTPHKTKVEIPKSTSQQLGSIVLSEARKPITNDWTSDSSAETFQNALNRRDRALGLLPYILALLTGLSQNYFGQNFGTVADYVKLILWAFGAKVAVDVLAGGMERWIGSQNR
jgi:hypothetical protein